MLKWIVMDMDGTLTNSKKEITTKTKEMLIAAQQKGARLVLASGRPTHGLIREANLLQMDHYGGILLSFNGAHVCSYPDREVLYQNTLTKRFIRPIIHNARALNLNVMVHLGNRVIVEHRNCYKVDYEANATCMEIEVVDDLCEYVTFEPSKFLISAPQDHLRKVGEDFKLPFGDMLSIYSSAPFYLEVMKKGIDKGTSLERIARQMNVKQEEIIAFGDEMNDLTMLQYAGIGVAMGNAIKPIKLISQEVTLSNDEDGIAIIIEKYLDQFGL